MKKFLFIWIFLEKEQIGYYKFFSSRITLIISTKEKNYLIN